jgi:hypothetical protein
LFFFFFFPPIRDICKVRKRQHQYPEFGHTQGEIKKKTAKNYISIQGRVKLRKPSILKRQHQYPEFGHTQGEIKKKPAKNYINIQGRVKLRKPSIF